MNIRNKKNLNVADTCRLLQYHVIDIIIMTITSMAKLNSRISQIHQDVY
jgi:hypothetical protein